MKDSPQPDVGPVLEFLRVLWQVNHALERRSRHMQARIGITAPQRMVVRMVGRFPEIMASDLAALLHVDRGTLSASLARLEAAGIVSRKADVTDRRRVRIGLTPKGMSLNRSTMETVESAVADVLTKESAASLRSARRVFFSLVEALRTPGGPRTRKSRSRRGPR